MRAHKVLAGGRSYPGALAGLGTDEGLELDLHGPIAGRYENCENGLLMCSKSSSSMPRCLSSMSLILEFCVFGLWIWMVVADRFCGGPTVVNSARGPWHMGCFRAVLIRLDAAVGWKGRVRARQAVAAYLAILVRHRHTLACAVLRATLDLGCGPGRCGARVLAEKNLHARLCTTATELPDMSLNYPTLVI